MQCVNKSIKTFYFSRATWMQILTQEPEFAKEIASKSNSIWTIGGVRREIDSHLAQRILERWPELQLSYDYENK